MLAKAHLLYSQFTVSACISRSKLSITLSDIGKRGLRTDATFILVFAKHTISQKWHYFLAALNICIASSTLFAQV